MRELGLVVVDRIGRDLSAVRRALLPWRAARIDERLAEDEFDLSIQ
jgi:hypothetical protein